jgi:hypothetical protein
MEGAKTLANSALHALLHIGIDEGGGGVRQILVKNEAYSAIRNWAILLKNGATGERKERHILK